MGFFEKQSWFCSADLSLAPTGRGLGCRTGGGSEQDRPRLRHFCQQQVLGTEGKKRFPVTASNNFNF